MRGEKRRKPVFISRVLAFGRCMLRKNNRRIEKPGLVFDAPGTVRQFWTDFYGK